MNKVNSKSKSRKHSRKKRTSSVDYQPLESKNLLAGVFFNSTSGIVTVDGTDAADFVHIVQISASQIRVAIAGVEAKFFANRDVSEIVFLGHQGDDWFRNETSISSLAFGNEGSDFLEGGSSTDRLIGGDGNDRLVGHDGDDTLNGGRGDDLLIGGNGDDLLMGAMGEDRLRGNAGEDLLLGEQGNDNIIGGNGNDSIFGGDDDDALYGGEGDDLIVGQSGNDFAFGDKGADTVIGNDGLDRLMGGDDDDRVIGGSADDILYGQAGADKLFGQDGNDWISGGDGDDFIFGLAGKDRILGNGGDDRVWGGDDDDSINGHDGKDVLIGDAGNDHLFGDNDDDVIFGSAGDDVLIGGPGDDILLGNLGQDLLFGEEGFDTLMGHADDDQLLGGLDDDRLIGHQGADTIRGGDGDDTILGQAGNDLILGQNGNDTVYGGEDDDLIRGGQGRDRLFGDAGRDDVDGEAGNDIVQGGADPDILTGGEGDDDIYGDDEDQIYGDDEDDESDSVSFGRPIGLSNRLTVSFVPDGTSVFDQSSQLFSAFSSMFNSDEIQSTILGAFNEWAQHGNLDVGLVSDSGDEFGTSGSSYGDTRFGDVRIGAMPMASDLYAIAIGQGDFVTGTWAGNILFNSNATFDDAEHFAAVALHEIGHVLGMEHTDNLTSAMHRFSVRTDLAPIDIINFQDVYGLRRLDAHDDDEITNNDSQDNATEIKFKNDDQPDGTFPAVVFGDISNVSDIDYFRLDTPKEYSGPLSFRVVSQGISQLAPRVSLINENNELLDEIESSQLHGDIVLITASDLPDQKLFFKVDGGSMQSLGSYSVIVTLDDNNTISLDHAMKVATGREFLQLDQDDVAEYFADPDSYLLNDDDHSDDDVGSATVLETEKGYEVGSRFVHRASLLDNTDIDTYKFKSMEFDGSTSYTMNISVRSLERGGMIPKASIMDNAGIAVPFQVAVNGQGEYVLQVENVESDKNYFLTVVADDLLPFSSGNYELAISYDTSPVVFRNYAEGTIDSGEKQFHSMHVAESQVIQFAFEADPSTSNPDGMIWATIYDQSGAIIYQVAARSGERRTAKTAFFKPGSYVIEIEGAAGSTFSGLGFNLIGIDVGGPQGPVFSDPTDSPFEQNEDGEYVYPDDVVTLENFVIVDGISSNQDDPPADDPPTDIFKWYWGFLA